MFPSIADPGTLPPPVHLPLPHVQWPVALARTDLSRHMSESANAVVTRLPQVIGATDDGKEFDHEDAQLKLDQGTPRQGITPVAIAVL